MRRWFFVVVLALVSTVLAGAPSGADEPCTGGGSDGGAWPGYGADLAGTRNQAAEDLIGPGTVGELSFAWATSMEHVNTGQSTAVVAGDCVYVASTGTGVISALDIESGAVVWQVPTTEDYPSKTATFALTVLGGVVYANASESDGSLAPDAAPVGVALNADTGASVYASDPVQFGAPTTAVASAVAFGDLQLLVTNGKDGGTAARPGYALIDRHSGATQWEQTTIPVADLDAGYSGGGQWATPVVDLESGYAFNGTANPYSKKKEHRFDNAIIKIDVDPDRVTFGQIVDAYKGNVDQFVHGLDRQVLCDEFGDQIGYHPCCNFSVTCVQLDIDFGGSPTAWHNAAGELMIGELQKSGVFHAVYADTMQQAWATTVSTIPPATAGNASSAANDGERVYVLANPGLLYALSPENGRVIWVAPVADVADYHPVSVANGVVYVLGNHGLLMGFDARDGRPLLVRSIGLDSGQACFPLAGGVSIARHTVLANCDGFLAAYRVPA